MTSVVGRMSTLERAARAAWLANSVDRRYGICGGCGLYRYLARQANRKTYDCLECWDGHQ